MENSDVAAFNAGFITVVPIEADYTLNKDAFKLFKRVIKEFAVE